MKDENKLPTALRKYANVIADYSDERFSNDGIWLCYKPFFKSSSDPLGCLHQEHEDTVSELVALVRNRLKCDCEDCHKQ